MDFGDGFSTMRYRLSRKSVHEMSINYDLLNGRIHMDDLKALLNPYGLEAGFIPDSIQHYSVINAKLEVLRGEEADRFFDFRVVVTNPNAVSEIEERKNEEVNAMLQEMVADSSMSEDDYNKRLEQVSDYFMYEWQDKREVRANQLLHHYINELGMEQLFNLGFVDAYTVGEEAYLCDIVGGEPYIEKVNPRQMRVIRSGESNRIEDADMIVLEGYWSPGKIIDHYWDQLSRKDVENIEKATDRMGEHHSDEMANIDERYGYGILPKHALFNWTAGDAVIGTYSPFDDYFEDDSLLPYDLNGNIRVLRVFWKSRRKIKKVKSYDPETGEEQFDFYPENYIVDKYKGEEEETFWVNEAWEGTKIGSDIYVNMRPRPIQFNRLSNPSRCHFGIIGSLYNINDDKPFSLVDVMKPYAYLYDVVHDRLNKILAKNMGKIIRMDTAKVPKGWDVEKWLYYVRVNNLAVENSFRSGDIGPAQGKLAGALNNASSGVIDASLGNEIQQYVSLLEWIAGQIGTLAGISRQREGQISNRETVGGVERSTLQSSYITKRLFFIHDDVKKRVLEAFLETAKIAMKGRKEKFRYILSDGSIKMMEIDGDEFAECDYGLVVDNSVGAQELNQKIDVLAQAALQNQLLDFSSIMKLYTTRSLSEKMHMVESNEKRIRQQQEQLQQQQQQLQQQQLEQQAQVAEAQMQQQYQMHQEDNETKILVAQINGEAEAQRFAMMNHDNDEANVLEREKMSEQARQFDEKLALERQKQKEDARLKEKQISSAASRKK